MTTLSFRSLQVAVILSAMSVLLTSCLKDDCRQFYTYKLYKPVYMSYDQLRTAVNTQPATDLKNVGKVYYLAPFILINEVDKGIHVIDNTNPSAPQNVAFINIPGNLDMAVKDHILYADSYVDLLAIDISDPTHAREVWRDHNEFEQRSYNGWTGDASKGVIIDWVESDSTIESDCTTPSPWVFFEDGLALNGTNTGGNSGSTSTGSSPGIGIAGSTMRFTVSNDYLYCLNTSALNLYDVSNASTPVNSGSVFTGWGIETLFPYENKLFIGTTTGVSIYDNSIPAAPTFLSTVSHVTGCDPVVVEDNYAYATIHSGNFCGQSFNELNVIDISNPSSPFISKTFSLFSPRGLAIDGNKLFVCDDNQGLQIFDASNPVDLANLTTVSAGTTQDVIAYAGWLLLISKEGIYQFDYSTGSFSQLSFIAIAGN